MRALLVAFALTVGCADTDVQIRPLTRLPDHAEGRVSAYGEVISLSEGVAFAFDCETSGGAVCYGLDAHVRDPELALVERMHLDSDVIRELEIEADRLPTGDSRVYLLVGLRAGSTTLVLTHDAGTTEIPVTIDPR